MILILVDLIKSQIFMNLKSQCCPKWPHSSSFFALLCFHLAKIPVAKFTIQSLYRLADECSIYLFDCVSFQVMLTSSTSSYLTWRYCYFHLSVRLNLFLPQSVHASFYLYLLSIFGPSVHAPFLPARLFFLDWSDKRIVSLLRQHFTCDRSRLDLNRWYSTQIRLIISPKNQFPPYRLISKVDARI